MFCFFSRAFFFRVYLTRWENQNSLMVKIFFFKEGFFMKKVFIIAAFFSVLFFTGCVSSSTHINKLKISTSDAPEVHGMNTNWEAHSSMARINGKINVSKHKNVSNSLEGNEVYEMGGVDIAGKLDYLYKGNTVLTGFGLGYDDGLYHHFTLGWNFLHFEFGGFLGFFHQYSDIQYSGEKCSTTKKQDVSLDGSVLWTEDVCTSYTSFGKHKSEYITSLFAGAFAGIFIDKYFFNYSFSSYSRNIEIEDKRYSLSSITSHYFTLGYRLNKKFEFGAGVFLTKVGDKYVKWQLGMAGSISYYLL